MSVSLQLCGLLLYAFCSVATSQERVWHSTTTPAPHSTTTGFPLAVSTTTTTSAPHSTTTGIPLVVSTTTTTTAPAPTSPVPSTAGSLQVPENAHSEAPEQTPPVLPEKGVADAEDLGKSSEQVDSEVPVHAQNILREKDKVPRGKKEMMHRKWMSVESEDDSSEVPTLKEIPEHHQPLNVSSKEVASKKEIVEHPPTEEDEVSDSITALLNAAEVGIPMVQETIVSKKTTVYVTITESMGDNEPTFVNLTGIRDFTGRERRIVGGCLDLSDLNISGEEAKEILLRMARHKFHRLDLSNNAIQEFPTNTFSPVAFSVRELRLDGNPLLSNDRGEGSMLQRGGLFHLTELRELNLSGCGLQDIDFFTPWNSNHLEVVDLSANNLQSVPTNLQFFHKLKKLFLDGNPITRIGELPFALLWNLQTLSVSGCLIASITSDPFRNMERLKEISLAGNNLTRISDVRLPRSNSAVKMFLSGNPWHCACDILAFVEHYHYAIRDLEDLRCASPRWLEGLRTAYLTKEILSLDSIDGGCSPLRHELSVPVARHITGVRGDRLEVLALAIFFLAAVFMVIHVLCTRKKEKYKFDDARDDINYIRIDKKPCFK